MSPLKRHTALVPLSKDHHFGLLLCWKIRQGLSNHTPERRISDYIIWFFDKNLKIHFELEEAFVFPLLDSAHPLRRKATEQHRQLETIVDELKENKEPLKELISDFEKCLEKHIRFEERELFEEIQKNEKDGKLLKMENLINRVHLPVSDNWKDHFWAKVKQQPI